MEVELQNPNLISETPLVSIIIPTYNRAHLIGETLDSILAQTYVNWECIIVDDGSTDNTDEIVIDYIARDTRFSFYIRPVEKLKGPNSCRNFGFSKSKGDLIHWFDSDDLYHQDTLNKLVDSFDRCDLVVCKLELFDSKTKIILNNNEIISNNLLWDYFTGNITFYVSGPIWSKAFLKNQSCLFDEEIRYLDDWDFNLRMLYNNPRIKYIDEPLISYRIHSNSLSREVYNLNYEEIKSEIYAREKQLKIITANKIVNKTKAKIYIKNRYKTLLRNLLISNHNKKKEVLWLLFVKHIELFDFYGVLKTLLGYITYNLFNKGQVLFK